MQKEKTVKTYQRRSKNGKMITVKQHTAKYDAADLAREAAKKAGAGDELEKLKKSKFEEARVEKPIENSSDYGFTTDEFKQWYHWDQDADPKNAAAKKVEKALKAKMGAKGYKKYFEELTDSYSARGHNKAFKGLGDKFSTGDDAKASKDSKATFNDAKDVHKATQTNRFGEGETLKGKDKTAAVDALEKAGYKQVGTYLVPPKGKGPLYWNNKLSLSQAGGDDVDDLYSGHNVLKPAQRKTMEGLGYFKNTTEKAPTSSRMENIAIKNIQSDLNDYKAAVKGADKKEVDRTLYNLKVSIEQYGGGDYGKNVSSLISKAKRMIAPSMEEKSSKSASSSVKDLQARVNKIADEMGYSSKKGVAFSVSGGYPGKRTWDAELPNGKTLTGFKTKKDALMAQLDALSKGSKESGSPNGMKAPLHFQKSRSSKSTGGSTRSAEWESNMRKKYSGSSGLKAEVASLLDVTPAMLLAPTGYTKGAINTAIRELKKIGDTKRVKSMEKLLAMKEGSKKK